jgi:hypothetical protein
LTRGRNIKRFWITLLTVAMALVIALPAGAVKPVKPPKPTTSAPIAVYLGVNPMWVHEVADYVYYKVVVHNKTNSPVHIGSVYLQLSYGEFGSGLIPVVLLEDDEEVPAFGTVTLEYSTWPTDKYLSLRQWVGLVIPAKDFPPNPAADPEDLIGAATVTYFYGAEGDEGTVAAETAASVMPYGPYGDCEFDGEPGEPLTATRTDSEICILTPTTKGIWEFTMVPSASRPTNVTVTMRDHVPGNWCTLPTNDPDALLEDVGGIIKGRWKPGSPALTGQVYLPGAKPLESFDPLPNPIPWWMWITDGTCLSGGAGGDFFQVGNPESFYLWTSVPGTVTVTHLES